MALESRSPTIVRFGTFEVDLRAGELRKQGAKIKVQEQPFQVLAALLQQPEEVVTREELRQQIWPKDTFVDFDNSLNIAINKLREALGDSADNPRFIETLPRRGYRFIAPVTSNDRKELVPPKNLAEYERRFVNSIAVLPLVNASGDPDAEYLADGITDTLINSLSQLRWLRVMARSTVFHYKDRVIDARDVGRELGVRAVLMGRVLQREGTLVIRAELIDARDGSQLWGQQYHRKMSDIFQVQEEIATHISRKLRLRLAAKDEKRLTKRYTENVAAHQLYLKGRYHASKYSEEGFKKGMEYFNEAIAIDPSYSLAYEGLAYNYLVASEWLLPPRDAIPKVKAAATRALELDNTLAAAHTWLGSASYCTDFDFLLGATLRSGNRTTSQHHRYGSELLVRISIPGTRLRTKRPI
jgi:TolB-like protein